jgi:hypothetical protein
MMTPETEAYLHEITIPLRLSAVTPAGWPVVMSLWYLYRDGKFYCATRESARIVSYLRQSPRCGFEIAADTPPYCGVRGRGVATINPKIGLHTLKLLLIRYLGGVESPLARRLLARSGTEVAIIIEPVKIFTWDFSERMQGAVEPRSDRICP